MSDRDMRMSGDGPGRYPDGSVLALRISGYVLKAAEKCRIVGVGVIAGGGVKSGSVVGATDELGLSAAENRYHLHELHATILHLLGLDHTRLTFRHGGRDFRLTDVHGNVVKSILASG